MTACARCHCTTRWEELPLVQRIAADDCKEVMTTWPFRNANVIEARRCTCGALRAQPHFVQSSQR